MKQLFSLLLIATVLFAWSCKKESDRVEESPFFTFFDEANIEIDTTPTAASTWEYGFTFTPLIDGNVTSLGIKLPATGGFTVRLWKLSGATPLIISERSVTASELHNPSFLMIPEIDVTAGEKLGVTILANSFYRIMKKNGSNFTFPIEKGNLRIESFNEGINDNATFDEFPASTTDHVAPCVNVIFIAD